MTKSKKTQAHSGPGLDWAASHGPVTGALSAASGAGALALAGAAASMPWGWPMAIGAAGALGHAGAAALYRRMTSTTVCTRAASWLLAGGWTSWTLASQAGPLSWTAAGTLAALGVAVGAMASGAAVQEEAAELEADAAEQRALAREIGRERAEVAAEWIDRIKRVCRVQVKIEGIEPWENGAGFWIDAKLPGGGTTWQSIAAYAQALAEDAELELGCTIKVSQGIRQGRVILAVTTRPIMHEEKNYPEDFSPLSILTGIPWGLLAEGNPVRVFLREASALILGPPGSGKSTFVDGILAGFARCTDVITWVIDLKAGAVGLPWVRPWLEATGRVKPLVGVAAAPPDTRPGVDWLAGTPAEAVRLLRAAIAVNKFRQKHYQDLMAQANTTLLPVSARIPQIEIVIDEGAELLSWANRRGDDDLKALAQLVLELMRTSRAMGIRQVLTAVDGNTESIGSTAVRKFAPVRVALTSATTDRMNVDKLFGNVKIDVHQLSARGSGVIGQSGDPGFDTAPFKGWKTKPSLARDVVLATAQTRSTGLDGPSARHLGAEYAERWSEERAGWLWNSGASTEGAEGNTPQPKRGGLNLSAFRNDDQEPPQPPPAAAAG